MALLKIPDEDRTVTDASAVRDFLAESGESDQAAGSLDQGDAEQGLQLAKAGGKRRLGHEAGRRRLAEMAVAPERHQILQLLEAWQVDRH